jgi:G8 domain
VQVRAGDRVTYDLGASPPIRSIHVAGALTFATDRDTRLEVGVIKVQPGDDASESGFDCAARVPAADPAAPRPALEVGSPARPVGAAHTALIRLVYFDGMDKDSCPAIVCCGGRMEFHGAPLSRTWVKLGATAEAGATAVVLAEPVSGWRVGDRVIITATQRDRGQPAVAPKAAGYGAADGRPPAAPKGEPPLTEARTVVAIAGTTLTLDRPLAHPHLGAGRYRGEVANLSRNVIVESADPAGPRGHTMYHRGSAGSIGYAEFRHLGKRGVLGRYAVHFHLCGDTLRGSSVVGASVWDSDNRWVVVHGTDYLVVRDCVGYRSVGHGFYVEDGTEAYNVFDRNLAVRASAGPPLPQQALLFDRNEGAGFWWANCHNTFTRNVACDCDRYGFRFEASPEGGFDLRRLVRQPDGTTAAVDIRTLPFVRFEDNEAHGAAYGLNLGQEAVDRPGVHDRHSGVGPDVRHPFIIRNTTVWNTRWGVRPESPALLVDGLDIYACVYGFYRAKFRRHAYARVTIVGAALPEAFSQGDVPAGLAFPGSGAAAFARVDAALSAADAERFRKLLVSAPVELAPADAERLVRGSYHTGGRVDGRPLPRIREDPRRAPGTGVSCGPLSSTAFPQPLDPVDDLPPATVITAVEWLGDGRLAVRGTTSDNGPVKCVRVNGRAARAVAPNFAQWEAVLDGVRPGAVELTAGAEDTAGNVEQTPHRCSVVRPG